MRELAGYLLVYIRNLDRRNFLLVSALTAICITLNYSLGLEHSLLHLDGKMASFTGFYVLYFVVFTGSYLLITQTSRTYRSKSFVFLLLATPAIFAWRMASGMVAGAATSLLNHPWDRYWAIILNAPLKCAILMAVIFWINKYILHGFGQVSDGSTSASVGCKKHSDGFLITGLRMGPTSLRPFVIILLCFVPVIIVAGSQPAFQAVYPKFKSISFIYPYFSRPWIAAFLYDISYAFDFLFVEVFFRGFLVLAFLRYAGTDAILPMAAFYCAIHFGKPLPECVSSYFGGIILGAITLRTGSVIGGIVLHLGMGMVMEIVGWLWQQ